MTERRPSGPPAFVVADWNLPLSAVEKIATRVRGKVMVGKGVNHAVVIGAKPIMVRRLGLRGSDHEAILFTIALEDGTRVRVLWWNVYVGQEPTDVLRQVATMADDHQPHLIALCEAYRCRSVLAQVPAYKRLQGVHLGSTQTENSDVALLVRRDVKIRSEAATRMHVPWIGPKHNLKRSPRVYRRGWFEFPDGGELRFLAAHLPTGGPDHDRNGPAVRESVSRIIRWAKR